MTYAKRGLLIRITYLCVAVLFFTCCKILKRGSRGSVVLCYHGVKDGQRKKFLKQMQMAKSMILNASSSKCDAFRNPLLLTFDDAFANLLDNAVPALRQLELTAIIFVPVGNLGEQPPWLLETGHSDKCETIMSIKEIQTLKENPFIGFGSHTIDHPRLTELNRKDLLKQLRNSRMSLENILCKNITALALPYGDYNDEVIDVAIEEGYQEIYSLDPVVIANDNTLRSQPLGRFSISPDDWIIEYYLTINGAYRWLAPWRSFLCKFRRSGH